MSRDRVRQLLLACVAAVFLAEAGFALVNPRAAAERVGYSISGPDGLSEYRAVYLGMFGVLGVATLYAAWHVRRPLLADVICLAIVGEAIARSIGFALDGIPGRVHILNIIAETAPVAILLIRPSRDKSATSR